jgi:aspartyl protease family protein
MPGAIGLGIVLFAMAVLVANEGEQPIAGLTPDEFASVAALGALGLLVASLIVSEFRGRWLNGVRAIVLWTMIFVALVGLYSYRIELGAVAGRVAGELMPGQTTESSAGEVSVSRRLDGSFVVNGRVNDREARFIFDTGASTVVLTNESAKVLGLDPAKLTFVVPVSTANGMTLAAPVSLERVAIGSIQEQRVRALVAKPGVLHENLLGMTFLERLASYEVRNNRLILRGKGV